VLLGAAPPTNKSMDGMIAFLSEGTLLSTSDAVD